MMSGWYPHGGAWGGWLVMTLVMLAFWALVVAAVVTLFRSTDRAGGDRSSGRPSAPSDPLAILEERLARGDIDVEEYHALRSALRGPP